MIVELLIAAVAFGGTEVWGKLSNGRFPRPTYAALVGWWWGSFAEDSPGALLASMIDSDLNCEAWKASRDSYFGGYEEGNIYFDIIESDSYYSKITFHPKKGRCKLKLRDKQGAWHEHKVTAYEDYLLSEAKDRWKSRKVRNEAIRIKNEHMDLVNARVNENYMNTLNMIEQRILNSDTTVTDPNLRALLPAPDVPVPVKEKKRVPTKQEQAAKALKSIEIEHRDRVGKRLNRQKKSKAYDEGYTMW